MRKLLFIGLLCLSPLQLFATGQIGERIIIGKDTLQMLSLPLDFLDPARASMFRGLVEAGDPGNTALGRGYVGEWEIRQDTLRLLNVYNADAIFKNKSKSVIPVDGLIATYAPASWFSGEIRIVSGERIFYEHSGFHRYYETETFYTLQNGVVVGKEVFHNHVIGDINSFRDALQQLSKDFAFPATPDPEQYNQIAVSFQYIPDTTGRFAGFRKITLYLRDTKGRRSEISDPEHPYLLEFQRRLREIAPYGVCYKGEMQPIAWTFPLRLPDKKIR